MQSQNLARVRKSYLATLLCVVALTTSAVSFSEAQTHRDSIKTGTTRLPDMSGKFRAQASFDGGIGLKSIKLAETKDNQDVDISAGGGFGGSLSISYGISSSWELSLTAGLQKSELSVTVENAEGQINRTVLLATMKYGTPAFSSGILRFGGGIGLYIPGDLDLDFSKVSGGGHNAYSYDPSVGFHMTGDYEMPISSTWSWGFGVKFYFVTYSLKSAQSNGINIPIKLLPQETKNDVTNLNGGGFDLTAFIAVCL